MDTFAEQFDDSKLHETILGEHHNPETKKTTEQIALPIPEWDDYAIAYKDVADHLVDGLRDRLVDEPHLACPIMFLYRHYLELALKEIIDHLQEWHDVESDYSKLKLKHEPRAHRKPDHPLMDSWNQMRSLIEQMEDCKVPECTIDGLNVEFDAVEQRIKEFDRIDRSSFNYRYPVDKKGRRNNIRVFDRSQLAQVKAVVAAVDFHLSSISYAVREANEQMLLLFEDGVDSYWQDRHADYLIGEWKDARY